MQIFQKADNPFRNLKPKIHLLPSADKSILQDPLPKKDGLTLRDSGSWIGAKHKLLAYYAKMFATGMKRHWESRVYLELFSGPGKCFVRESHSEEIGSPLKVIDHEFTKFIFTERNAMAADALAWRLERYPNSRRAEIWCGDALRPLTISRFLQGR